MVTKQTGCCSYHRGTSGQSTYFVICNDGWQSSCRRDQVIVLPIVIVYFVIFVFVIKLLIDKGK